MATFKLEGEETPETGAAPSGPPAPAPDEFSFFLDDESDKTKPASPSPATTARPAPNSAASTPSPAAPAKPAASPGSPAASPRAGAPAPARPTAPPSAPPSAPSAAPTPRTNLAGGNISPASAQAPTPAANAKPAQPAPPNLMRPAQPRGDKNPPRADASQPPGLNVPAAVAEMPVLTQPDAASIAQSDSPSDDFSSALENFGRQIARALDAGEEVFTWLARLALPIAGLSLAYILAAVLLGSAAKLDTNPNAAQVVHFLTLAAQGFSFSLLVLAVSLLLISYDDNRLGAITAATGVFLSFGLPLLLLMVMGQKNFAAHQMIPIFIKVGKMLLWVGGFKLAIDVVLWAWNLPNQIKSKQSVAGAVGFGKPVESKQQRIARSANMFSPCWKLPFCREAIRVLCPAFLAKKTCWKFKRGCYCDEEMVGRIVRNEPIEQIKAANTRQSKEAPPCARCYIFLEHQTYKFRMLSPLALPATILLTVGAFPMFSLLFLRFTKGYLALFATLSFSVKAPDAIAASASSKAAAAASQISPEEIAQYSTYIFAALLGFLALIYISKFIEWAIFKAKW